MICSMVVLCFLCNWQSSIVTCWGWFTLSHVWIVLWLSLSYLGSNYLPKLGDPVSALGGITWSLSWIHSIPQVSFRTEKEENKTKQKEWLLHLWLLMHWARPKHLKQVKAFAIHDFLILLLLIFNIIMCSTDTENTTWPSQIMANNPVEQVMVTNRLKYVNINCWGSVLKNKCILRNHA